MPLVEDARAYFVETWNRRLEVDEVCKALAAYRPQLQQRAFRARLRRTAMEEFSAMRIGVCGPAAGTQGASRRGRGPDGYCSGAYFREKFRAATGHTTKWPTGASSRLPAKRQNRQQKDKAESKTSIAESPQKSKNR